MQNAVTTVLIFSIILLIDIFEAVKKLLLEINDNFLSCFYFISHLDLMIHRIRTEKLSIPLPQQLQFTETSNYYQIQ